MCLVGNHLRDRKIFILVWPPSYLPSNPLQISASRLLLPSAIQGFALLFPAGIQRFALLCLRQIASQLLRNHLLRRQLLCKCSAISRLCFAKHEASPRIASQLLASQALRGDSLRFIPPHPPQRGIASPFGSPCFFFYVCATSMSTTQPPFKGVGCRDMPGLTLCDIFVASLLILSQSVRPGGECEGGLRPPSLHLGFQTPLQGGL